MDNIEKIALVIAIGTLTGLTGLLGYSLGQNNIRKEAILHGHARYAYKSDEDLIDSVHCIMSLS